MTQVHRHWEPLPRSWPGHPRQVLCVPAVATLPLELPDYVRALGVQGGFPILGSTVQLACDGHSVIRL